MSILEILAIIAAFLLGGFLVERVLSHLISLYEKDKTYKPPIAKQDEDSFINWINNPHADAKLLTKNRSKRRRLGKKIKKDRKK